MTSVSRLSASWGNFQDRFASCFRSINILSFNHLFPLFQALPFPSPFVFATLPTILLLRRPRICHLGSAPAYSYHVPSCSSCSRCRLFFHGFVLVGYELAEGFQLSLAPSRPAKKRKKEVKVTEAAAVFDIRMFAIEVAIALCIVVKAHCKINELYMVHGVRGPRLLLDMPAWPVPTPCVLVRPVHTLYRPVRPVHRYTYQQDQCHHLTFQWWQPHPWLIIWCNTGDSFPTCPVVLEFSPGTKRRFPLVVAWLVTWTPNPRNASSIPA